MAFAIAAAVAERLVRYRNLAAAGHCQYLGAQGCAYAAPFTQVHINCYCPKMHSGQSFCGHNLHLNNLFPGNVSFSCVKIYHIEIYALVTYIFTLSHNEIYLKIIQLFCLIHILLYLNSM